MRGLAQAITLQLWHHQILRLRNGSKHKRMVNSITSSGRNYLFVPLFTWSDIYGYSFFK